MFLLWERFSSLNITEAFPIGPWSGGVNTTPLINRLFVRRAGHHLARPIFGSVLESFAQRLVAQGYPPQTIQRVIGRLWRVEQWLQQRQRITSLRDLLPETLAAAVAHFRPRDADMPAAVRAMGRFLQERGLIPQAKPGPSSRSHLEAQRFGAYLVEVRGLAGSTVDTHIRRAIRFLEFMHFNRRPRALCGLRRASIEEFVRQLARTNTRFSLAQALASLRGFLRFEFSQGKLALPLHEQIDRPRLYLGERLPRAAARTDVTRLLRSIDRSRPAGMRDFTILYLAATYGLRSDELRQMRVEDIDWRNAVLNVQQAKTRQVLRLPLLDEAGEVLARYLRLGRPRTGLRQLFFLARAPMKPLGRSSVGAMLRRRLRRSGLSSPNFSMHGLRHSVAVHLVRRGVPIKSIGDVLGHRDLTSTAVYLRLNVDDLRTVGLPVPRAEQAARLLGRDWGDRFPRIRNLDGPRPRVVTCFRSGFARSLNRYLENRRTLGRGCRVIESVLRLWDTFLHDRQGDAPKVSHEQLDAWLKSQAALAPVTRRQRLLIVRRFLVYHRREHPRTFVPDWATFPKATPPRHPRLVSPKEMGVLLATATQLGRTNANPLRAGTIRLGLLLLFCCGLRQQELLRLQIRHYDRVERLLRIEATKFHKSRLVPLPTSAAKALETFLALRRARGLPYAPGSFLLWSGERRPEAGYTGTGLTRSWQQLCLSAGVLDERGRAPRLHDLRHSFAVEALHRWYAAGINPQARLVHLATYLGHVNPSSSHYYLQFTPALRAAASERFERSFGILASNGGAR
ncbi:MAG: tyrosine-type recombinase/integrase [Opitutaceae bacterium]|nr:tyrosine-type recombinase/integrase [Opitutaceae bacterium]